MSDEQNKSRNWAQVFVDFLDDGGEATSTRARFFASLYGSLLLHVSLIVVALVRVSEPPDGTLILSVLPLSILLSFIFGIIISTGTKGGLIRRFWYGITLPAACYYLASRIIFFG